MKITARHVKLPEPPCSNRRRAALTQKPSPGSLMVGTAGTILVMRATVTH